MWVAVHILPFLGAHRRELVAVLAELFPKHNRRNKLQNYNILAIDRHPLCLKTKSPIIRQKKHNDSMRSVVISSAISFSLVITVSKVVKEQSLGITGATVERHTK